LPAYAATPVGPDAADGLSQPFLPIHLAPLTEDQETGPAALRPLPAQGPVPASAAPGLGAVAGPGARLDIPWQQRVELGPGSTGQWGAVPAVGGAGLAESTEAFHAVPDTYSAPPPAAELSQWVAVQDQAAIPVDGQFELAAPAPAEPAETTQADSSADQPLFDEGDPADSQSFGDLITAKPKVHPPKKWTTRLIFWALLLVAIVLGVWLAWHSGLIELPGLGRAAIIANVGGLRLSSAVRSRRSGST
jgi:hypothetical protein